MDLQNLQVRKLTIQQAQKIEGGGWLDAVGKLALKVYLENTKPSDRDLIRR